MRGLEVEGQFVVNDHLAARFGFSRAEGNYLSYRNGPCPLEHF